MEQLLKYTLMEHKTNPLAQLSLPEPTIARLNGHDYLILTRVNDESLPSVTFFKIAQSSDSLNVNSGKIMPGSPTYQIDGAEMYLGQDFD